MNRVFEELSSKELRVVCKENGISYSYQKDGKKHTMTKQEMVDALYDNFDRECAEATVAPVEEVECVETVADDRVDIDENTSLDDLFAARAEIDRLISQRKAKKTKKDPRNEEYDENFSMYGGVNPFTFMHTRNKERYIEEAEVGTLVAFLDGNGKPRTAALINRSSKRRLLKLKTEFDWEFEVPYDSVLWVRKGDKWAYGIYRILKGYNPNGKCGEDTFRKVADEEAE